MDGIEMLPVEGVLIKGSIVGKGSERPAGWIQEGSHRRSGAHRGWVLWHRNRPHPGGRTAPKGDGTGAVEPKG